MNNSLTYIFTFTGGCIVGAAFMGLYAADRSSLMHQESWQSVVVATTTDVAFDPGGAVSVTDQKAGARVVVDSITVPPPGVWVAVREIQNGDLSNILGAARARGPISGLAIDLLRSTVARTSYAVVLYRDDGDGIFDGTKDSVYVDFDSGKPVVAPFVAK